MTTPTPNATLYICLTCGMKQRDEQGNKLPNPASQALAAATTELLADSPIRVELTRCLSMCDTPIAWALHDDVHHTYSFAPATTAEDLATTARAWLATTPGEKLPKKDMPTAVPATLISRIPPLK